MMEFRNLLLELTISNLWCCVWFHHISSGNWPAWLVMCQQWRTVAMAWHKRGYFEREEPSLDKKVKLRFNLSHVQDRAIKVISGPLSHDQSSGQLPEEVWWNHTQCRKLLISSSPVLLTTAEIPWDCICQSPIYQSVHVRSLMNERKLTDSEPTNLQNFVKFCRKLSLPPARCEIWVTKK